MGLSAKIFKQLDDFRLNIEFSIENELVVLFGHSGAGKSLTLKCIAGLLKPDSGNIILNDNQLFADKKINIKPQYREMGYVFQNHSIFPHMTVLSNILFGAKGFDKYAALESAEELIRSFRLKGLENKYPHEISGGQQQRVVLARALIRNPKALLLDEPFSALDMPIRIKIRECLKKVMKKLNIPVILVTHDIFEACSIGDKIYIYKNGEILQNGTPSEIKNYQYI